MGTSEISVVIPAYNSAQFVTMAIDSVLAQTHVPAEIIVVDDGSTDDTKTVLQPYMHQIRYVYQRNGGLADARNRGIRESTGRLIAFLDADDQWLPEKLAEQLACLEKHHAAGLVHTNVFRYTHPTGEMVLGEGEKKRAYVGRCVHLLFKRQYVTPSSVLVRRQCLDSVGVFDSTLRACEDLDLWLRIARTFDLAYVYKPLVLYRIYPQGGTNLGNKPLLMAESELAVLHKAVKEDHTLIARIGPRQVRSRLASGHVGAAYLRVAMGDLQAARQHFWRAFLQTPWNLPLLLRCGVMALPRRLVNVFREVKQKLRLPRPARPVASGLTVSPDGASSPVPASQSVSGKKGPCGRRQQSLS